MEEGKTFFETVTGDDLEEMSRVPELRNEKIDGDSATLEAKGTDSDTWDPKRFVKEDGGWKIAIFGDEKKPE